MNLEQIKIALQDRNLYQVAKKIGVHYNTLYNIMKGKSEPSRLTFFKLQSYLKA